jgi:hypothetical protein
MEKLYQTVKIEGDDRIHVTKEYSREVPYMLCGEGNIVKRSITKVSKFPTCKKCSWQMLSELNKNSSSIRSWEIINHAYVGNY